MKSSIRHVFFASCLLLIVGVVEAQAQSTQKVAIPLTPSAPTEADKKAKADKLAAEDAKQQQLVKERALQIADKQLWISQHPAEYQAMLNQLAMQQTLSKVALNKMPAAKRDQILAHPEQYKIVD